MLSTYLKSILCADQRRFTRSVKKGIAVEAARILVTLTLAIVTFLLLAIFKNMPDVPERKGAGTISEHAEKRERQRGSKNSPVQTAYTQALRTNLKVHLEDLQRNLAFMLTDKEVKARIGKKESTRDTSQDRRGRNNARRGHSRGKGNLLAP